jgi:hypothetical protein
MSTDQQTPEEKARVMIAEEIEKALSFKPKKFNKPVVDEVTGVKKWHKPRAGTNVWTVYQMAISKPTERNPHYEEYMLNSEKELMCAVNYAVMCVKVRWPELEEKLLKNKRIDLGRRNRISEYLSGIQVTGWEEFERALNQQMLETFVDCQGNPIDFSQCSRIQPRLTDEEPGVDTYQYKADKLKTLIDIIINLVNVYKKTNPSLVPWFNSVYNNALSSSIALSKWFNKNATTEDASEDESVSPFTLIHNPVDCQAPLREDVADALESFIRESVLNFCKPSAEYVAEQEDGFLHSFGFRWRGHLRNIAAAIIQYDKLYNSSFKQSIVSLILNGGLAPSFNMMALCTELGTDVGQHEDEALCDFSYLMKAKRREEQVKLTETTRSSRAWHVRTDDAGMLHDDWEKSYHGGTCFSYVIDYVSLVKKTRVLLLERILLELGNCEFGKKYASTIRELKRDGNNTEPRA